MTRHKKLVPSQAEAQALERIATSPLRVNRKDPAYILVDKKFTEAEKQFFNPDAPPSITVPDSRSAESRDNIGKS